MESRRASWRWCSENCVEKYHLTRMHTHAPWYHCAGNSRHRLREEWFLSRRSPCLGRPWFYWTPQASIFPLPHAILPSVTSCWRAPRRQVGGSVGRSLRASALPRPGTKSPTEKNKQDLLGVLLSSCSQSTPKAEVVSQH